MAEQNNYQPSAFWFGFSLGTIATGLSLYFLGTKKGREKLKKIMDLTENLEENALVLFQELEEHIESANEPGDTSEKGSTLMSVLSRMKNLAPHEAAKDTKRFFVKETKK